VLRRHTKRWQSSVGASTRRRPGGDAVMPGGRRARDGVDRRAARRRLAGRRRELRRERSRRGDCADGLGSAHPLVDDGRTLNAAGACGGGQPGTRSPARGARPRGGGSRQSGGRVDRERRPWACPRPGGTVWLRSGRRCLRRRDRPPRPGRPPERAPGARPGLSGGCQGRHCWWQLATLHGAFGDDWRGDFLSYEASTYFGMLCAAYVPN
jgi:hypothetical protein